MKCLSLFDGISCGRVALERAGIPVERYYASEIDKYAIQVAQKNYPDTIQIGDVTQVKGEDLPKIDLLIGGSPCQGFSFAGKQLNFEDPRSKLFFEFVRLLEETKPKYFLLENVKMKKEYQDVITSYLGVEPIKINSALVSAQNRERLYWANFPIEQPDDKGIKLIDILESDETTNPSATRGRKLNKATMPIGGYSDIYKKSKCIQVGKADIKGFDSIKRVYSIEGKSPTLTTMQGGHREPKVEVDNDYWRPLTVTEMERLQTLPDGYTEGVSNSQRKKCLGNGWTVDVIAHIFEGLKEELHK